MILRSTAETFATRHITVPVTEYIRFWKKHYDGIIKAVDYIHSSDPRHAAVRIRITFDRMIVPGLLRARVARRPSRRMKRYPEFI